MKINVAISISVNSLKAYCAGMAAANVVVNGLKDHCNLVAIAGASGGSIAAAHIAMNYQRLLTDPLGTFPELLNNVAKFRPKDIIDVDLVDQGLDLIMPWRKKSDFTGLARGNALRRALTRLYGKDTRISYTNIPLLISSVAVNGRPPYDRLFVSHWNDKLKESKWGFVNPNEVVDFNNNPIPLANIVRASTAIPGIFRPERLFIKDEENYLVDGGTLELIPDGSLSAYLRTMNIPCDLIISINTVKAAYGDASLPPVDDLLDVMNAAYVMNYSSTYEKKETVSHNLLPIYMRGLQIGMCDTHKVKETFVKASETITMKMWDIVPNMSQADFNNAMMKINEVCKNVGM